jgi:adenine deaminase
MMRAYSERVDALEVLLGNRHADLVVAGGKIVDVWSGSIRDADVAVTSGTIVAAGDVQRFIGPRTEIVDATGRYLTPGLIETHLHVYESNLNPTEFARVVLKHGTTALPEAMYGAGQIRGLDAVRFFTDELRRTPITVLSQVPALGYLQNLELGIPGGPNSLDGDDLRETLAWESCVGVEEPPFIPIAEQDPVIRDLMERTLASGRVVMGHGAGLNATELLAYAAAGITSDHEAVTAEEALARVQAGMVVSMRESCVARNQRELQRAVTEFGASPHNFMFCADVLDPVEAAQVGHIDQNVRLAISGGVDPVAAVQMATINAARYYRMDHAIGSLAPGRQADIVMVSDLDQFKVETVVAKGRVVVRDGEFVADHHRPSYPAFLKNTVRLAKPATAATFVVEAAAGAAEAVVRVIGGESLVSPERQIALPVVEGAVTADPSQDVIKLAMLDRYGADVPAGIGFLQGYGLSRGAIGTTYNPMYHNVLVAGTDDQSMAIAANALAAIGGGFVAVDGTEVVTIPLELCGLMSDRSADEFLPELERLYAFVRGLGCTMESPFHNLAFTAVCGELPFMKLGHLGPFDVQTRQWLPLLVGDSQSEFSQ